MMENATLTDKQERFVREYMIDQNATQAAIRCGYSPKQRTGAGGDADEGCADQETDTRGDG